MSSNAMKDDRSVPGTPYHMIRRTATTPRVVHVQTNTLMHCVGVCPISLSRALDNAGQTWMEAAPELHSGGIHSCEAVPRKKDDTAAPTGCAHHRLKTLLHLSSGGTCTPVHNSAGCMVPTGVPGTLSSQVTLDSYIARMHGEPAAAAAWSSRPPPTAHTAKPLGDI